MVDTLKIPQIIHDTLFIKGAEGIDVLNKTDAFYNNAWGKLMALWAILAIVIPAVITWYQRRELRINTDRLKEEIRSDMLKAQNELKVEIKKEFDVELQKHVQLIEHASNRSDAGLYFQQGIRFMNEEVYAPAFGSFLKSAVFYYKSQQLVNLKKSLLNMQYCLYNLSEELLLNNELSRDWENRFKEFYSNLKSNNEMSSAHEDLEKLKATIENLPKTEAQRLK